VEFGFRRKFHEIQTTYAVTLHLMHIQFQGLG